MANTTGRAGSSDCFFIELNTCVPNVGSSVSEGGTYTWGADDVTKLVAGAFSVFLFIASRKAIDLILLLSIMEDIEH